MSLYYGVLISCWFLFSIITSPEQLTPTATDTPRRGICAPLQEPRELLKYPQGAKAIYREVISLFTVPLVPKTNNIISILLSVTEQHNQDKIQSFEWYTAIVPVKYQQYHSNNIKCPFSKISGINPKRIFVLFSILSVLICYLNQIKLRYSDNFLSVSDSCNSCPICYNGYNRIC